MRNFDMELIKAQIKRLVINRDGKINHSMRDQIKTEMRRIGLKKITDLPKSQYADFKIFLNELEISKPKSN